MIKNRMREKKIKNNKPDSIPHSDLILKNIDEVICCVTLGTKGKKETGCLSDKIKDILGVSKEKYLGLGEKIATYWHPEDRAEIINKTAQSLKKKIKNTFHYRFFNPKKKKYIWIEETIYPQLDKKKKLIGYYSVSRSIENEKQKEEELNQRWLNYRNLIESLPSGIFIHVNGKIIFGNKSAYRIAEISKKENLADFSLLDFLLPKDRPQGIERIKKAMAGKDTPFVDYNIITRKGNEKVIRTKSSPIIYNTQSAVQIIILDITNEKKLEEERVKIKSAEQINKGLQNEISLRVESEQKLNAIFESTTHLIWTLNRKREIISYNKQYAESVKNLCGTTLVPGIKTTQFKWAFSESDYRVLRNAHKEAFKGRSTKIEIPLNAIDGKIYHREMHFHPIAINGKINEIAAVAQDTTERRNYEKQIGEQSSRLKAIFESGAQLMWTVNRNISLTSFNKNYSDAIYEMYGVYPEINTDLSKPKKKFATEEYHKFWDGKYEEVFKSKSVEFDTERTTVDGKKIFRHIFLHPIYDGKNEIVEVSGVGYDISEQKKVEEEILNKQSQLSAIINNTDDIILSIDKNRNIVEFNNELARMFKIAYKKELKAGMSVFDTLQPKHHADIKNIYKRVFKGESVNAVELFGSGENKIYYETHYNPIITEGAITGIAIFTRNITHQKQFEEETLKTLKEKDVLLKEIHHRVKNNLQVISSILNLQTAYLKDRATINILKECQNRIKTMAFIHESLYQNKDFSQINFSEYIVTLVKNLFYSFEADQQKIRPNFDVEPILLSLDTSIPCGLIVNELVSNALKYAFNEGGEGAVFVELKRMNNKIKMVISDNGKGMPESINYKNTETLGLQLVNTLTEQINGTISMNRNKGTIFEIIF